VRDRINVNLLRVFLFKSYDFAGLPYGFSELRNLREADMRSPQTDCYKNASGKKQLKLSTREGI
jgi:hypothetical protein